MKNQRFRWFFLINSLQLKNGYDGWRPIVMAAFSADGETVLVIAPVLVKSTDSSMIAGLV